MKIVEVIEYSKLERFLNKYCIPFLKQVNYDWNKNVLWRGTHDAADAKIISPFKNRNPMNMIAEMKQQFNIAFASNGFTANRNSIFCSGNIEFAKAYGALHRCYPLGDFSFTWSPKIEDLFIENYEVVSHTKFDYDKPISKEYFYKIKDNFERYAKKFETTNNQLPIPDVLTLGYFKENYPDVSRQTFVNSVLMYGHIPPLDQNSLNSFVKKYYRNDDLIAAIKSQHEIMIDCKKMLLVKN